MKPLKRCNAPACRALIPFDVSHCNKHIGISKRETNRAYDDMRMREEPHIRAFYADTRWHKLSEQVKLRDDYMCQECLRNGFYTVGNVSDHIIEVRDDWDRRWDINNLQTLCVKCHNKKTREEKAKRNHRSPRVSIAPDKF